MMLEKLVLGYAMGVGLTTACIAGFVVVSPIPGESTPAQTRVGLVVALSALTSFSVAVPAPVTPSLGALAAYASFELVLGLVMGLAFRFVLSAADVLGNAASQAMGLGVASLFDPALGTHETPIERFSSLFAMMIALAVGAHRVALSYLIESFRAVPVGRLAALPPTAPVLVEAAGTAIATGVRLAMPVVAVCLALQLVLAFVGRAAPSLQIFSVGFTVLLLAGIATLSASLRPIGVALAEHIGSLRGYLERMLLELGPG